MAKKLSVDLELSTQGYVASIKEAKNATADYTSAVNVSNDQIKQLNREVKVAQKEALGLAQAYAALTTAQKNSAGGQALKRQLDEAKKNAAQLLDVSQDARQEIQAMASDTAGWDAAKQGIDIVKDATMAYAGVVAKLTGNEEDLKDVIATLTIIENGFSAAIKIGNALQKQSALMTGIRKVQSLAAAKAVVAETTATKGATIAQKAFNAVAKANPYVLLASAIIAVTAAVGAYMLMSKKAAKEDENAKKKKEELAKAQQEYNNTMASTFGNLMGKYEALRASWKNLASDHEKNEWIKKNKNEFEQLGLKVNNINDAENVFEKNTAAVIEGFKKRAEAAAIAAQMVSLYTKQLEIEQKYVEHYNKFKVKEGDKAKQTSGFTRDDNGKTFNNGQFTYNDRTGSYEYTAKGAAAANDALLKEDKTLQDLNKDYKEGQKQIEDYSKRQADLSKTINNSTSTSTTGKDKKTEQAKTQLQALEDEVKKAKTKLENIDLKAPNADQLIKDAQTGLAAAQKAVKDYKLKVGLEVEQPKSTLDKLNEQLNAAKGKLEFAATVDDVNGVWDEIHALEKQIENEEIRLKLKVDPKVEIDKDVTKALQAATSEFKPKLDVSNLSGEEADKAQDLISKYQQLQEVVKKYQDQMNAGDATDEQIATAQAALERLMPVYDALGVKVDDFVKKSERIGNVQKQVQGLGSALNAAGNAFSALGQATGDESFNIMGTIAQAIADVVLGYANATSQASSMGPWAWIAFAITGLATMITMISNIKSQTSGYAEGGVIGGHSYYGDKLMARVNSGETILNTKQQQNALDLMDAGMERQNNVILVGMESVKVRGSELFLTLKNYTKTTGKKL